MGKFRNVKIVISVFFLLCVISIVSFYTYLRITTKEIRTSNTVFRILENQETDKNKNRMLAYEKFKVALSSSENEVWNFLHKNKDSIALISQKDYLSSSLNEVESYISNNDFKCENVDWQQLELIVNKWNYNPSNNLEIIARLSGYSQNIKVCIENNYK